MGVFASVMNQQDGLEVLDGVCQTLAVGGRVKPLAGRSNDLDRQGFKTDLRGCRNSFQPLAHHGQGVFGREQQHLASATSGIWSSGAIVPGAVGWAAGWADGQSLAARWP
jgi:hypothetical protein